MSETPNLRLATKLTHFFFFLEEKGLELLIRDEDFIEYSTYAYT